MGRQDEDIKQGKDTGTLNDVRKRNPPIILPDNTDQSPDIVSPDPGSKVPGQTTHQ